MFKWRGTVPFILAAVMFGIIFSYTIAEAEVQPSNLETYENQEFGLTLKIPKFLEKQL